MAEDNIPICNYPNDQLSGVEWSRIERQCKSQRHLAKNENLKDRIQEDAKTLAELGITCKQIGDFMRTIKYRFSKYRELNNHGEMSRDEKKLVKINTGMNFAYKGVILDGRYEVFYLAWMGAEECPFQSPLDKKYHGYEYGYCDWGFHKVGTDEWFRYGDLLMHEIEAHGFFQSEGSHYRVDPKEFIEFFELKPGVDYSPNIEEIEVWESGGGVSGGTKTFEEFVEKFIVDQKKMYDADYSQVDRIETEDYDAILMKSDTWKAYVLLNRKNKECKEKIEIFDRTLNFKPLCMTFCRLCESTKNIYLDEP